MDWDLLRVFLAVARTGRVSGAARRLGVEHTTIARRLAALEGQLGVALFYRTAAGYRLTPHGERIQSNAEAMEHAALGVGARAREELRDSKGRVRIALLDEFASHWVAPLLPKFRAAHPGIEVRLVVGIAQLDITRGEADLAGRLPRPRQPGLTSVRLARTRTALYAARGVAGRRRLHVTDLASLRGLSLLVFTPEFRALQSAPWFQPILDSADVALSTNSTHALLAAARAGAGVAVLPPFVGQCYEDLVLVSEATAFGEMWLVTHPEFRRDPRVRAVAGFLREEARVLEA